MERLRELLGAIKNWTSKKWGAFAERFFHSRSEARICARLDGLEAHICGEIAELEAYIVGRPKELAPTVIIPEASVALGSVSVPIGDGQRAVEFQGIELSQRFYAEGLKRITETLYDTGRGRYLVHVRTLHRGKGLRTEFNLCEIDESDLREGGRYSALWQLTQPIGLEGALTRQ